MYTTTSIIAEFLESFKVVRRRRDLAASSIVHEQWTTRDGLCAQSPTQYARIFADSLARGALAIGQIVSFLVLRVPQNNSA